MQFWMLFPYLKVGEQDGTLVRAVVNDDGSVVFVETLVASPGSSDSDGSVDGSVGSVFDENTEFIDPSPAHEITNLVLSDMGLGTADGDHVGGSHIHPSIVEVLKEFMLKVDDDWSFSESHYLYGQIAKYAALPQSALPQGIIDDPQFANSLIAGRTRDEIECKIRADRLVAVGDGIPPPWETIHVLGLPLEGSSVSEGSDGGDGADDGGSEGGDSEV